MRFLPRTAVKIILAAAVIGALIFFNETPPVKWLREKALWVLRPIISASEFLRGAAKVKSAAFSEEEMVKLLEEGPRFKSLGFVYEKAKTENEILRKALDFREEQRASLILANVLRYSRELGQESLLLDRGASAGVRRGDWVVDENGLLVGMVKESGEEFSSVEVASNPGTVYEIIFLPLRVKASAQGIGARTFLIGLLPKDTLLKKGDFMAVFSRGSPELLMGEVADIQSNGATVFLEAKSVLLSRPDLLRMVTIIHPK